MNSIIVIIIISITIGNLYT